MRRGRLFTGAVLLQALFLGGLFLERANRVATGTRVFLETQPYDPYSPFRGRYAVYRLSISDLPPEISLPVPVEPYPRESREWVYVTLEPADPYWRPVGVARTPPTDGAIFIAGWLWGEGVRYPARGFFLSERGADRLQFLTGKRRRAQAAADERGESLPDEPYPLGVQLSLGADGSAVPVALYWGDEEIR